MEPTGSQLDVFDSENTSNVLVLSSAMASEDEECLDSMTNADVAGKNVLYVDLRDPVGGRIERWLERVEEPPARMKLLCMDETRSAAAGSTTSTDDIGPSVFETVGDPADLSGLGTNVTRILRTWAKTDEQTIVCFESVTALLDYVDLQGAFGFLHVLTRRVEKTDSVAHYHMDSAAHDPDAVETLEPLFDAVVGRDDRR